MPEGGMVARLYVLAGPDLARSFALAERATLGRSDECDVVLHDRSISRKHAELARQDGAWFLRDLGSTNGISKGGKRLERFELEDGDEFKLGDLPLRFRLAQAERSDGVELAFAPPTARAPAPVPAPPPAAPPPAAPVAAVPVAAAPAPADEDQVEVEIEIDDAPAPSGRRPAFQPLAATAFSAPRAERRTGLLGGDVEQRPWWWQGLVVLSLLAFSVGLCYAAFWAVQTLRGGP